MRALDFFVDWLTEQKKSEQIYIAKELLKNLEPFEHRDLIFEELEKLDPFQLEEAKGYIDGLLQEGLVTQCSDDPFQIMDALGEKHENN